MEHWYFDSYDLSFGQGEHWVIANVLAVVPDHHLARLEASLVEDEGVTRATDAFAHYVFEAYARLNMQAHTWPRLERWFDYDALGLLTTLEAPEPTRSDCHGWSAHAHYHLFASLLGIRPGQVRFRRLRIAPHLPAALSSVEGVFPHPVGNACFQLTPMPGVGFR